MSVRVMSLVYNSRLGTATRKAVALKMADCATDAGTSIWPSLETIAFDTEISKSTVQRTIKELVKLRVIEVVKEGGGRRKSTEYRFNMPNLLNMVTVTMKGTGNIVKMTTKEAINMVTDDRKHGQALTTEPLEPSKERERGALAVEAYLAEDWVLPPDWRTWAAKRSAAHAHMIDLEAEKFRAFWVGKEIMRRNWRSAWEKWWLDTVGRPPSRTPLRAITGGSRAVHNTEESLPDYTARMIREGKFKPMPIAAKEE